MATKTMLAYRLGTIYARARTAISVYTYYLPYITVRVTVMDILSAAPSVVRCIT